MKTKNPSRLEQRAARGRLRVLGHSAEHLATDGSERTKPVAGHRDGNQVLTL
jgi:hypothetical protein